MMKTQKLISLCMAIVLLLAILPLSAHAASAAEQVYELNKGIYNSAVTGENAGRYYLMPSERIESDDKAIIARAMGITDRYTEDMDKARAIHDWVCDNIWGDLDVKPAPFRYPDQNALDTLNNGRAVCTGYANLTAALLRAAGIPAKYVRGRAAENGVFAISDVTASNNHAWVEALINERWVIIDTTWDSGNRWQNGRKTISTGMINRKYFDISLADFSKDHRIDEYLPFMGIEIEDGVLKSYGGPGDDLPESITKIGQFAFNLCSNFTRVVVPYGVEIIGSRAFIDKFALAEVNLPASLRAIEGTAFNTCKALKSIHIPNGVTSIGSSAFARCEVLSDVFLPPTLVEIGSHAFSMCPKLLSVVIPPSVKKIESEAFGYNGYDSSMKSIAVPGFSIIGVSGSAAEEYAIKNGFRFVRLSAVPTKSKVVVNGAQKAFDAYNIAGNNYFKLRDLAFVLSGTRAEFDVGWDETNNAISLIPGESYTQVGGEMAAGGGGTKNPAPTGSKIYMMGREVSFAAYKIDGNNYFKLRDIGAAFDFSVIWDDADQTIVIDTNSGYEE